MWLNMIFLCMACLAVGGIVGWIIARPRSWRIVTEEPERDDEPAAWDGSFTG